MFGIGLPEMLLILALALIVVGPDKLPDLARSVAKGVMELKKTAEALKKNLTEDGTLDSLKPEITNLLESSQWETKTPGEGVNPAPDDATPVDTIIEAELTEVDEDPSISAAGPAVDDRQPPPARSDSEKESQPRKE